MGARGGLASLLALAVAWCTAPAAAAQSGGVSPGDIVETNVNYQPVVGEVLRTYGGTADLNLGQNNVGRFLEVQYMKVVQKAGSGAASPFGPGDTVRYSNGSVAYTGRILKTNGAYCEMDSSGSGFTGWMKCAQLRLVAKAAAAARPAAAGPTGVLALASGFPSAPGDRNPVADHGFYLLRDPLETALAKGGFAALGGVSATQRMHQACARPGPDCQKAVAAILADSATAVKSGPDGRAVFPAVVPGGYFVFGTGQYRGKPVYWDVRVTIRAGENTVTLEPGNVRSFDP